MHRLITRRHPKATIKGGPDGDLTFVRGLHSDLHRLLDDHEEHRLSRPEFIVSALFLEDCYRYLTRRGFDEEMCFVTGMALGATRTLDRLVPVELDDVSPVGATANLDSSTSALIDLVERGHRLHAIFHKHPGRGIGSAQPSSIDMATQRRFEASAPVIGAIFTADGAVQFFRADGGSPDVRIYGKGFASVPSRGAAFTFDLVGQADDQRDLRF